MSPLEARRAVGQPDIVIALRNSIQWHVDQGRPHSEMVDRDALAEIERLRAIISRVRHLTPYTDAEWAMSEIRELLEETL